MDVIEPIYTIILKKMILRKFLLHLAHQLAESCYWNY